MGLFKFFIGVDDKDPVKSLFNRPKKEDIGWHDLRQAIDGCRKKSSPGPDTISYEMVKHLPVSAQRYLLLLFNRMWTEGKLVEDWKEALVIPIPNPDAPKAEPQSYRPIALTAVFCENCSSGS